MSAIPGESGCWPRPNPKRKYAVLLLPLLLLIAAFITTIATTFLIKRDRIEMTAAALLSEWHQFRYLFYFFCHVIFATSSIDRFMNETLMALFTIIQLVGVAGLTDQVRRRLTLTFGIELYKEPNAI
jgi:hypothetical protein